jgi:succinyl-diaminopimelate desuccinylase
MYIHDPITIVRELLSKESITPNDAGCMEYIETILKPLGFEITYLNHGDTKNMYARLGTTMPNFCFLGHTDVVPPGRPSLWENDPFKPTEKDGFIFARGACDMKGAIAAFLSALSEFLYEPLDKGSISLLLTSDEEGSGSNGTKRAIVELIDRSEYLSACLVGEPTNPKKMGEMYKIGRRGSMNCNLTITGRMGHVAYPELAHNPMYPLADFIFKLKTTPLDMGTEDFEPSRLEITSIDTGNPVTNLIPSAIKVKFNVRFNALHRGKTIAVFIRSYIQEIEESYPDYSFSLECDVTGEAFICEDKALKKIVEESVNEVCNNIPVGSTTGGTSDGRFIYPYCPVIEFGLISDEAHKANEKVSIDDLFKLKEIYRRILEKYFPRSHSSDYEFNMLNR